jgi:hypothetical protein
MQDTKSAEERLSRQVAEQMERDDKQQQQQQQQQQQSSRFQGYAAGGATGGGAGGGMGSGGVGGGMGGVHSISSIISELPLDQIVIVRYSPSPVFLLRTGKAGGDAQVALIKVRSERSERVGGMWC